MTGERPRRAPSEHSGEPAREKVWGCARGDTLSAVLTQCAWRCAVLFWYTCSPSVRPSHFVLTLALTDSPYTGQHEPDLAAHRVEHLRANGGPLVGHPPSTARVTRCARSARAHAQAHASARRRPLPSAFAPMRPRPRFAETSSRGARAQAQRPPDPGGHAGRARHGGRRRWRRGGGADRRLLPLPAPCCAIPSARPEPAACAPLRPAAAPAAPHVLRRPADCFRRPQAASDPTRSQYICLCAHSSVYIMCCL